MIFHKTISSFSRTLQSFMPMYCGSFSNCEGSVAVGGNLYSGCYGYGFLGLISGVPCQHIYYFT